MVPLLLSLHMVIPQYVDAPGVFMCPGFLLLQVTSQTELGPILTASFKSVTSLKALCPNAVTL